MSPNRYSFVFILFFLFNAIVMVAQDDVVSVLDAIIDSLESPQGYQPVDSAYLHSVELLLEQEEKKREIQSIIKMTDDRLLKKEMSFRPDGSSLVLRGFLTGYTKRDFVKSPGEFKSYDMDMQDYGLAGAPLAASWILKVAGVESRSTTRRMMTSNVLALALSAGLVKTLKLAIDESRPDGKGEDSFPSGHSSMAFVGATILHREFGHHSPWISVGGYTAATATQLLRLKHNRHWAHDTFIGAGIGVMSTNLAYFLTDKIFGKKEINRPRFVFDDMKRVADFNFRPSSISFVSGSEMGSRKIKDQCLVVPDDFAGEAEVRIGAGFMAGVEGSLFVSPNVAFDAMFKLTTSAAKLSLPRTSPYYDSMCGSNLDFYRFSLGVKYSYPFAMSHRVSFRLFAGTRISDSLCFESASDGVTRFRVPGEIKFDSGLSVMYDFVDSKKYSSGFTFDYHHTDSDIMPHRYSVSSVWRILL